jgi:hypothetical protein
MSTTASDAGQIDLPVDYDDAIADNGEIKVDVVNRLFSGSARKLFEETLDEFMKQLFIRIKFDDELNLTPAQLNSLDKYKVKVTFRSRKAVPVEERCIASKKDGNPCGNKKKDGYQVCGTHLRSKEYANSSVSVSVVGRKTAMPGQTGQGAAPQRLTRRYEPLEDNSEKSTPSTPSGRTVRINKMNSTPPSSPKQEAPVPPKPKMSPVFARKAAEPESTAEVKPVAAAPAPPGFVPLVSQKPPSKPSLNMFKKGDSSDEGEQSEDETVDTQAEFETFVGRGELLVWGKKIYKVPDDVDMEDGLNEDELICVGAKDYDGNVIWS